MKVIFLDIDGVLNEEKSRSRCGGYRGIDNKKVEILAKIVEETGARLVLTSTWKNHWQPSYKEFQGFLGNYLDRKMKKYGLRIYSKVASKDRRMGVYYSRGESILYYLSRNKPEKFVILDDYQYDYDSCGLTDYHVKTDNDNGGLTERLAVRAIAILNGEDNENLVR